MRVDLRRAGLVLVGALVGLTLVGAQPAQAFSSLDSPQGLAVLQAGATGLTASGGTSGLAAGVSGVGYGASAASGTAGVAASVGLFGWASGWFRVGSPDAEEGSPSGVEGLTVTGEIPPGWTAMPVLTNPVFMSTLDGRGLTFGNNITAGQTTTVTVGGVYTYRVPANGYTGVWTTQAVFDVVCRQASGALVQSYFKYTGQRNSDGGGVTPMAAQNLTSSGGNTTQCPNGLDHFVLESAEAQSGPANWNPTRRTALWYPVGHPLRPEGTPAGSGQMTRTLRCVGPEGETLVTDALSANISTSGAYEVPALKCPAGMTVGAFGADWTPAGGVTQAVVPETQTEPWVQAIPTEYPQCMDEVCRLELFRTNPAPTQWCGTLAVACPDWYQSPTRAESYECRWGPYVVETDRCSVYRVPGQVRPNAEIDTEGKTQYQPWPPAESGAPVGDPAGDVDADPRDCWPNGFSLANPFEWVYMPVACALEWAFVPTQTQVATAEIAARVQTKTPLPELTAITAALDPPEGGTVCMQLSLPLTFVIGHDVPLLDSCTWSDPVSKLLRDYRPLLAAAVWISVCSPLAWWAWRQYAPGASGVA